MLIYSKIFYTICELNPSFVKNDFPTFFPFHKHQHDDDDDDDEPSPNHVPKFSVRCIHMIVHVPSVLLVICVHMCAISLPMHYP